MENFCWIMVLKDWKFVWVINKRNPNVWVTNRLQTNVTQTLSYKQVTNKTELEAGGIGGEWNWRVCGIGGGWNWRWVKLEGVWN